MAEATDKQIVRAAHALRAARRAHDAAYDAHIKACAAAKTAERECATAFEAARCAQGEFDRLLELRPAKDV